MLHLLKEELFANFANQIFYYTLINFYFMACFLRAFVIVSQIVITFLKISYCNSYIVIEIGKINFIF